MTSLPIDAILLELRQALSGHASVVLAADPGAGKTTRVPIALRNEPWLAGKRILMLEPRRLAAVRSAQYMAALLGEKAGESVGYRIRGEARVSPRTAIEILTEGILTRMLQSEPDIPEVGLLIFDEFHERSIHADLGLALALDVQQHLRPDLRILVMSATLNGVAISGLLRDAPVVRSSGRMFPVDTRYLNRRHEGAIEPLVSQTIVRGLNETDGDILVFLPGQREIRRVESMLYDERLSDEAEIHMLYGEASQQQQQSALGKLPGGKRKVILSTNIAETSLTIEGIGVVIDAGLSRISKFDARRGMSGLVTVAVSRSSADQRRGRSGRLAAGVCYRLWTEAEHESLPQFSAPEILLADLAPLAIELAQWGDPEGRGLRFLDPPPAAHLAQARSLLQMLGALDEQGSLTPHGTAMAALPVHPRLAHMLIRSKELGLEALACDVAALLEERDILRNPRNHDVDFTSRVHALQAGEVHDKGLHARVLAQSKRLRALMRVDGPSAAEEERCGILLALAYPERVARRQGNAFQLAGGMTARLPERSLLVREAFLAVGEVDGIESPATIFQAAPLSLNDLKTLFAHQIVSEGDVRWDARAGEVVARSVTRLGALILAESPSTASTGEIQTALLDGIRDRGLAALPWSKEALSMRERSEWLRRRQFVGAGWPDLSDAWLLDNLDKWLAPFLGSITKIAQLHRLEMTAIVRSLFDYRQLQKLDRLAPTHITVPTGSRIALDYSSGEQPVLPVRLQEMFGERESPRVAGGKEKVIVHLLSPAHRPLAVTADLASFWRNAYADVRKEMRGRYPKHHWPEDPLAAQPTRRTKRAQR